MGDVGASIGVVYQKVIRSDGDITRRQAKHLVAKRKALEPSDDIVTLTRTYDDILQYVCLKSCGIVNPCMLIASKDSIDLLRAHGPALFIDATHAMVDKGCQLVTITIVINGHGLTPAYGITRSRTHDSYVELFRSLSHLVGNQQSVQHIVLDAEESLHSSVRATWPNADIHLCYFHYVQACRKWFTTHRGHDNV